jgi:hypothetical protein
VKDAAKISTSINKKEIFSLFWGKKKIQFSLEEN